MSQEFRLFLNGLRPRGGYCVDCLGRLYDTPSRDIEGYIRELDLPARHAECANCGEQKDTYRDNPSV